MQKFKSGIFVLVMALVFMLFSKTGTTVVKADAAIKSQQGVVVRSANLTTDKVIKVPAKETAKSTSSRSSLSRGGSDFSGGTTLASGDTSSVVSYAYKFMGRPYVWGAEGPKAFDCSGFTLYVYSAFGVSLPHYTGSQAAMGKAVSKANLASGDLVFFNTYGSLSHVGIYVGGGQFIHASSGSSKITVSSLDESYYQARYAGARRILN